jgi:hypothetical protein
MRATAAQPRQYSRADDPRRRRIKGACGRMRHSRGAAVPPPSGSVGSVPPFDGRAKGKSMKSGSLTQPRGSNSGAKAGSRTYIAHTIIVRLRRKSSLGGRDLSQTDRGKDPIRSEADGYRRRRSGHRRPGASGPVRILLFAQTDLPRCSPTDLPTAGGPPDMPSGGSDNKLRYDTMC